MELQQKVVLITGASMGIGLETARVFAGAGARLALAARSVEKLEDLAAELRSQGADVMVVPTDMRETRAVQRMVQAVVQHFGRVDVLINNAGQSIAGAVADVNMDELRQIYDLNIFGVIDAIQAVVPVMRGEGGGIIVNVSSMTSKMNIPRLAGYASTKAALNLLSATARAELAPENIRVFTVYPRMTATDFGKNALGNREIRAAQRAGMHGGQAPTVDSAQYVAEKILEAVQLEIPEQFMDSE